MLRWLILVFLFILPTLSVFAQGETIANSNGCTYNPETFRAAVEADGWVFEELIQITWSPNCLYVSMRLAARHGKPGTTIAWDVQSNTRIGTIEGFSAHGGRTATWDPSGDYLVVTVDEVGTYLWHVPSNRQMLITTFDCGLIYTHWDYERQQVYATSPMEWSSVTCSYNIYVGGLRVYDLNTGATVATYSNSGYTFSYEFSDDGRFLILTDYNVNVPVRIWDLTTGVLVASVDVDQGGGIAHGSSQIELSPDGRYLAIGMRYIRVWDLSNLPADLDEQEPVYRYAGPDAMIRELHFVDNQIIETVTWNGTQRWDLMTGALIP